MTSDLLGHEYSQLRAFVAVAERSSFARAAEALAVSPSALSQTIRSLEERLGARLLNRTTRSVAITQAGESLLQRIRPAMTQLAGAVEDVARSTGRITGPIRLMADSLAVELYLQPSLQGFSAEYPEVTLDVTVDDGGPDIVRGGFDAAFRQGETVDQDLVAVKIGPDLRKAVVASPTYLARHGMPRSPEELVDHQCIRHRRPGRTSTEEWEFSLGGTRHEVPVSGPLIVSDRAISLQAALNGLGIACVTTLEVEQLVANGSLVSIFEDLLPAAAGFRICYPRQRQMCPALQALIDVIKTSDVRARPYGPGCPVTGSEVARISRFTRPSLKVSA